MTVNIKITKCVKCPYFTPEDEDIDVYHGCAYTYFPPKCSKNNKKIENINSIPKWCPLKK